MFYYYYYYAYFILDVVNFTSCTDLRPKILGGVTVSTDTKEISLPIFIFTLLLLYFLGERGSVVG
jgi:hypothetical protein